MIRSSQSPYQSPYLSLRAPGKSHKKTLHASEQHREDVQRARREWRAQQPGWDPAKLVFLDETAVATNLTRLRGRSMRGARCLAQVPHGHYKSTTFIAGLRCDGVSAPLVIDGAMDGAMFVAWVRTCLAPSLNAGDVVIADNLSSHKVAGVREALQAVGADIIYLPPYSPDLNPIEKCFAKLKAMLRKAGKRTVQALWDEVGRVLDTISPTECRNYFQACGYVND